MEILPISSAAPVPGPGHPGTDRLGAGPPSRDEAGSRPSARRHGGGAAQVDLRTVSRGPSRTIPSALGFVMDRRSAGLAVARLVDHRSGDVVLQLPPEGVLAMVEHVVEVIRTREGDRA